MTEGYIAVQVVMMPKDANPFGTIFGGVILSHIDLAGSIADRASEFLQHRSQFRVWPQVREEAEVVALTKQRQQRVARQEEILACNTWEYIAETMRHLMEEALTTPSVAVTSRRAP